MTKVELYLETLKALEAADPGGLPYRSALIAALTDVTRLKHELSVVVSTRHKEASASAIAKQRAHFLKGMQRYAKGVM